MRWNPEWDAPAGVVIIGGNPQAIEAALYARFLGYQVELFESWRLLHRAKERQGRVGLGWREVTSSLGRAALEAQGVDTDRFRSEEEPQWEEWVEEYLLPLARTDLIHDSIHVHSPVGSISRLRTGVATEELSPEELANRADDEFRVLVHGRHRGDWVARAEVVIDCSGIANEPLGLGIGGGLACNEKMHRERLRDAREKGREGWPREWAGQQLVVWGSTTAAIGVVERLSETMGSLPGGGADGARLMWLRDEGLVGEGTASWERVKRLEGVMQGRGNQVVMSVIGVERLQVLDGGGWELSVATDDETSIDIRCDQFLGFPPEIPNWQFTEGLLAHRYLKTRDSLAVIAEEIPNEIGVKDDWSGWRFATEEPNYYVLGGKRYWPDLDGDVISSRRDIRDVFALIGGRRNLDLYQQFAVHESSR